MFEDFNTLDKYPAFAMTNGFILQEMMAQKNIGYEEIFSILGPESIVREVIHGKRLLKASQIKQLSELFGTNQEIFSLEGCHKESISTTTFAVNSNEEGAFLSNENSEEFKEENVGPNFEMNGEADKLGEENSFEMNSEHGMKSYWDD